MHRILIVSDEEFLRDVIRLSLADMQADVRCASDVPDMQRMVRRMLFDLVVVVGTSAFFTGCDVVRTLRPAGLGRPLVYVVAWQQAEQTVLSLLECGVDQYMTFPVSLQRLRRPGRSPCCRCSARPNSAPGGGAAATPLCARNTCVS